MFQVNKSKELLGILLANTGTPDDPNPSAIKRYLREFLSDKRIIQIPRFIWLPILFLLTRYPPPQPTISGPKCIPKPLESCLSWIFLILLTFTVILFINRD